MQEIWERQIQSLGQEDFLEEGMATYSSVLVWRIPWTEEPGGLHSIRSERVRHNWSNLACTHNYPSFLSSMGKFGVSDYIILCKFLLESGLQANSSPTYILLYFFFSLPVFFSYSFQWVLGSLPKETASLKSLS